MLILSLRGFAQNYEPVIAGKEYLYSVPDKSTLNKPFYNSRGTGPVGIRVKKDTTIGQQRFYLFNGHIRNGCDSISCFGKKELVEASRCVFFNAKGDSIIFKNNQPNGSTWPIYTYPNGSYLQAAITAIEAITVLKYTDTAKFISLTYKDKVGNTLSHIFNNKTFILGKNLGFIRTYDLAAFPADTSALKLAGLSSPALGIQNIKEKDIYNFEVGDEFHYEGREQYVLWQSFNYWYSHLILSKKTSVIGDTLMYKIERKHYRADYYNSVKTEYFKHDTITMTVVTEGSAGYVDKAHPMGNLPFEGLPNSDYSHAEILSENDTTYKTLFSWFVRPGSPSNRCYVELLRGGGFDNFTYAAGRGIVSKTGGGGSQKFTQVYYKKKNREWGTPINFQTLLSNEASAETSRSIEISPNPASNFILVKSTNQSFINSVSIANIMGNEIIRQELTPNSTDAPIDISSLSSGIYLIRTRNGSSEHITRFVVAK